MDETIIPLIEEITEDTVPNYDLNLEEFQEMEIVGENDLEEMEEMDEMETAENCDFGTDDLIEQLIDKANKYVPKLGVKKKFNKPLKVENNDSGEEAISENVATKKKPFRVKRTLPPHLEGLMGQGNAELSKGNTTTALEIFKRIIKEVPRAPEPYLSLSYMLSEDDPAISLELELVAAYLSRDAGLWEVVAEKSENAGKIKQAVMYYSKAIAIEPTNVDLYKKRAKLQGELGEMKAYFKGYLKLVQSLNSNQSELVDKYAFFVAKHYMQEKCFEKAYLAMKNVFKKCDPVTDNHVNIMLEILIALKRFPECLTYLNKYTNIKIIWDNASVSAPVDSNIKVENVEKLLVVKECEIPDDAKIDHKAKCLIVLIELNVPEIAAAYLSKFIEQVDPEVAGDLYLDVAETFMAQELFELALPLLEPLLKSKEYNKAGVWWLHAKCLEGSGNHKEAIKSYEKVMELSPQHTEARIKLSQFHEGNRELNTAINVLYQNDNEVVHDASLIYKRTLLLKKAERLDEFLESGMLLISRHCSILKSRMEVTQITRSKELRYRIEFLNLHRLSRGEPLIHEHFNNFINTDDVPFDDEYQLFLDMVETSYRLKKYGLMQQLCFSVMTSKKFEVHYDHILYLGLISCIYCNDSHHGFNVIREFIRTESKTKYWNLLGVIIQRVEESRHSRFIMRLLGRREENFSEMHILHANNCLVSGTYKYALNDYMAIYKHQPSALLALMIGVTHLQMVGQKFAAQKNQIIVQGTAFMQKYCQMRGKDLQHEIYYNMGRYFHQLGLLPNAVHYYKLVLNTPLSKLVQDNLNLLDLRAEAAYNLHLIYLNSGNPQLARMYIDKFIVV